MAGKKVNKASGKYRIPRRNFLLGLGLLPVAASVQSEPVIIAQQEKPYCKNRNINNDTLKIGIIGFGFRGEQLARSLKFAHPDWIREQKEAYIKDHRHSALDDFRSLEDLHVTIAGVCDVYERRLARGIETAGIGTTGYKDYRQILADQRIEAVIIATPDHWHAQMAMDAAKAGKHVYLEKCMSRTAAEAVSLRNLIREADIVFQLGHQGRQRDANHKARQIIAQGTLGKISLVEATTNRNNDFGAWLWPIDAEGTSRTIDWELFEGPAPQKVPFSPERFFRWRCWYDYGTGMAGDLLTHEYDALNSILDLGIPDSAVASGGIYAYNDGRDVPDVFQANYEYAEKKLSLLYSGTLANGTPRSTLIMGRDATLELGKSLAVWADSDSVKYKNRIEAGIIDPNKPIVNYDAGNLEVDALTSATAKYFADRGLMYTYQDGRRYDTTHLHLKEWVHCIRNGGIPSCNIEQGFQEAITAHMATASYKQGKKMYWNKQLEKIVTN